MSSSSTDQLRSARVGILGFPESELVGLPETLAAKALLLRDRLDGAGGVRGLEEEVKALFQIINTKKRRGWWIRVTVRQT